MSLSGLDAPSTASRPAIPLVEVGAGGPVALLEKEPDRALALVEAGREAYGRVPVALADRLSRRWLVRTANPYLDEIEAVASRIGTPGAFMLNLSYEWCCTAGVAPDPLGSGNRMLRTLDWPLEGLGRHAVVARQAAPAGDYFNVTWPGFVGVMTALAPGRFAAALNQAPMHRAGLPLAVDWLVNRLGAWRRSALPPVHLLRRVLDNSRTYEDAKARLCETPICLPALYALSGLKPEEGCVIERQEQRAFVHDSPACITNHWLTPGLAGDDRGCESRERKARLERVHQSIPDGFDWLAPPILNADTRLAVLANAETRRLLVQGSEPDGPATEVFRL